MEGVQEKRGQDIIQKTLGGARSRRSSLGRGQKQRGQEKDSISQYESRGKFEKRGPKKSLPWGGRGGSCAKHKVSSPRGQEKKGSESAQSSYPVVMRLKEGMGRTEQSDIDVFPPVVPLASRNRIQEGGEETAPREASPSFSRQDAAAEVALS